MDVPDSKQIVALCGSQRDGSRTRHGLEQALEAAETKGTTTEIVDYAGVESYPENTAACTVPTID